MLSLVWILFCLQISSKATNQISQENPSRLCLRSYSAVDKLAQKLNYNNLEFLNRNIKDYDKAKEVEVSLLFFIINNSSSSQTNILAQLMDFFTGNGHLEALSKLTDPEALYQYISDATA